MTTPDSQNGVNDSLTPDEPAPATPAADTNGEQLTPVEGQMLTDDGGRPLVREDGRPVVEGNPTDDPAPAPPVGVGRDDQADDDQEDRA